MLQSNSAATVCADDITTVQAEVPEQPPPLQPIKLKFVAATAVNVTESPSVKSAASLEQDVSQLIATGALTTLPPVAAFLFTVKAYRVPIESISTAVLFGV